MKNANAGRARPPEPRVEKLVYRECVDSLFEGMAEDTLTDVDVRASGARFLELLEEMLGAAYPGAEIVTETAAEPVPEWAHVTVWTGPETAWRDDEDEAGWAREAAAERLGAQAQEDVDAMAGELWAELERWVVLSPTEGSLR